MKQKGTGTIIISPTKCTAKAGANQGYSGKADEPLFSLPMFALVSEGLGIFIVSNAGMNNRKDYSGVLYRYGEAFFLTSSLSPHRGIPAYTLAWSPALLANQEAIK